MLPKLVCGLVCAALAAQAADKVVGGPFAVNLSGRSATVVWIVQTGEASIVAQGATEARTVPTLRAEKVVFRGLKPGVQFSYKVPGEDLSGSFKTPPSGDQPFEFVLYGDNRTRPDAHKKVIQAVLAYSHPDFVVQTGDMVADGADASLWPVFFDIERELLRHVAFFPSLGNHEHNATDYYDFFQAAPYYSFDWGRRTSPSLIATWPIPPPPKPPARRSGKSRRPGWKRICARARAPGFASWPRTIRR